MTSSHGTVLEVVYQSNHRLYSIWKILCNPHKQEMFYNSFTWDDMC